ncbi:hypothetical protein [Breoghania sp.]|uniref:hypothetical protein n=1 Tax=Breoghania sp. TaxID=2065378 RepID=UPI00262BFC7E|nr:hypothetical protein [Breoghania sp.]MDJ0931393.1 hypothetical protein [Breoghania sp.]
MPASWNGPANPFIDIPAADERPETAAALRARIAQAHPEFADVLSGCLLVAGGRVIGTRKRFPPMPISLLSRLCGAAETGTKHA